MSEEKRGFSERGTVRQNRANMLRTDDNGKIGIASLINSSHPYTVVAHY